jgi:hypothetical protein
MFYCGGITSVLEGVGSAISDDGLVWKKMSVNHPTICPTRGAWNNTTISFPAVVVDLATRFAGAGELADVKMIMTGGISATWEYSNGAYVIPYLFVPVEESVYHIEPYCLPEQKASIITNDSSVSGATVENALETLDTNKLTKDTEVAIKVYSQTTEPVLAANNNMAIWIDTDDSNRTYIIFRRPDLGTGFSRQVKVELL